MFKFKRVLYFVTDWCCILGEAQYRAPKDNHFVRIIPQLF